MNKRMIKSILLTTMMGTLAFGSAAVIDEISTMQETIATLNQEIKDHQVVIDTLNEDNSSLNNRINDMTEQLDEAKKIIEQKESELQNANSKLEEYKSKLPHAISSRVSRGGDIGISRSYVMEATAYYTGEPGVGTVTASGTTATLGRTVAVDRNLIPLGTELYIEFPDMPQHNGYYVAEDVGGAVRGNIIDLYVDGHNTAINFGRRKAIVYVLS